jgi:hypothetical protein
MPKIIAMPKRSKKMAQKVYDSDLPLRLVEEMLKFSLLPKSSARNHWKAEIQAHLKKLQFGVSAKTHVDMATKKRCVTDLHFSVTEIQMLLNDLTSDASEALEPYLDDDNLALPENFEDGNIFDYGWKLSESYVGKCVSWTLTYQNAIIAKI